MPNGTNYFLRDSSSAPFVFEVHTEWKNYVQLHLTLHCFVPSGPDFDLPCPTVSHIVELAGIAAV